MEKKTFITIAFAAVIMMSCGQRRVESAPITTETRTTEEEEAIERLADTNDEEARAEVYGTSEGTPKTSDSYSQKGLEIPAPLTGVKEQVLTRTAYTVSYNNDTRLPNWVAWHLTSEHTSGPYSREGKQFEEDTQAKGPRADNWDYYNSGYDRGHMCPAADNKWSDRAMTESFLYTNACPQVHSLNAGDWQEMETQCRKWAQRYGDIYIVCGPILYNTSHKTIGSNKVVVPEAFFKVVLCTNGEPKAIGFIYKNNDSNRPMGDYVNTVDEVERITGIDFFPSLPDDIENKIEATCSLANW